MENDVPRSRMGPEPFLHVTLPIAPNQGQTRPSRAPSFGPAKPFGGTALLEPVSRWRTLARGESDPEAPKGPATFSAAHDTEHHPLTDVAVSGSLTPQFFPLAGLANLRSYMITIQRDTDCRLPSGNRAGCPETWRKVACFCAVFRHPYTSVRERYRQARCRLVPIVSSQ
jgi:hypothetical protein